LGERDVPLGINTAIGAVAVVVCCIVPAGQDPQGRDARFALVAFGVGVFAAAVGDLASVAVTVGVAFLLSDGFVESHYGDLVWHGRPDVVRIGVLCVAGIVGLVIGVLRRRAERRALPAAGIRNDGEVCGTTDPPADRDDRLAAADKSWGRRPGVPRQRTSYVAGDHPSCSAATPFGQRQ
jgi:hypothetical protein